MRWSADGERPARGGRMKRTGGLFPRVSDWDALLAATRRAALGKHHRPDVAASLFEQEERLLRIQEHLRAGAWTPGPCRTLAIREPQAARHLHPAIRGPRRPPGRLGGARVGARARDDPRQLRLPPEGLGALRRAAAAPPPGQDRAPAHGPGLRAPRVQGAPDPPIALVGPLCGSRVDPVSACTWSRGF